MLTAAMAGLLCRVATATTGVVVLGDLARDYQLKPGDAREATIELENRDGSARTVRIYQTDYCHLANGESFFPAPGSTERSNADWLTFSPRLLTIPPLQKSQVRYLLRVPRSRSKTGTFWSMMMIQNVPDAQPVMTGHPAAGAAPPPAASRSGVQIVTQLEETGRISLEFTSATIESRNSKRILTLDIENRGSRVARPEMWLEVYMGNGQKAGRFLVDKGAILPGCGVRREIDITALPKGTYSSLFIADCGKDVYGLEIKLVLEGDSEGRQLRILRN
ncbi:MAG: hypothetical protein HGB04_10220 [Chlorobiaceae bacterium]|nr:hypothetical protein [Chlorobiaceae bacterium]